MVIGLFLVLGNGLSRIYKKYNLLILEKAGYLSLIIFSYKLVIHPEILS